MISGTVPFEEIVQSVKDETGIENLRPLYEKIRRLIFRAEREIGYGGTVEIMKKIYVIEGVTNSEPNFGKYFKFPEDLIELEGIGSCCRQVASCYYTAAAEGVRFKKKQTKNVVLLYWGIQTDDNGYPIVTRNHEEAVVAYIVWKLYSQRIFLGIGNMNASQDYKETFTSQLLEARGDDAFPTLEQWNALGRLSYTDRRLLIDEPVHSYNYCDDSLSGDFTDTEEIEDMLVYYWQLTNVSDRIEQVIPLITMDYLATKPSKEYHQFELGVEVQYTSVGRACFVISDTKDVYYAIIDALGYDVSHMFDRYYDASLKTILYVSDEIRTHSVIGYKFKKQ